MTKIVIEQMLYRNPDVLLILSTYLPPDEENGQRRIGSFLSSEAERVLMRVGYLILVLIKPPSHTECPEFWRTNDNNRNLQSLTAYAGLQHASNLGIEFSLKLRSDMFLGRHRIVCHLRCELEHEFPLPPARTLPPRGRIVVSAQGTTASTDRYQVCDHWMFGYTEDLMKFFNLDRRLLNPGMDLAHEWMQRIGLTSASELLGRYMMTEDSTFTEQVNLSQLDYSRYLREGSKYLTTITAASDASSTTTRDDWLNLVRRYQHM